VNVALPWNEVSLNVARYLLVVVDSAHALWAWDFYAEIEPMNGHLKFVTCSLYALGATPNDKGSSILPTGNVPLPPNP
jgi:hypothetical protein